MEWITQSWPWYVAGPMIALVMFALIYFDKTFGFSSNLRTLCSAAGAGTVSEFFNFDWKNQKWNLIFLAGAILGGWISYEFLMDSESVKIATSVEQTLQSELGFEKVGEKYLPMEIFGPEAWKSASGILILIVSGFLVGFGARYAGGCTSGHAITGLSNLQLPSLIAVIGFFIGGLLMTYFGLPLIF
ncbi:YeeE/YedE family protein [Halocola ammonii]